MKYLIFDFDGVLGDTLHQTHLIKAKMDNKSYEQVVDEIQRHFENTTHAKKDNPSDQKMLATLKWIHNFGYLLSKTDFPLFTGFVAEIKKLQDTKNAIVSSGSKVYIDRVTNIGLDFTHVLDIFDHHSKEEKINQICHDWQVDLKEIYYFTDTQSDVKELLNVMDPTKIIGCAWGYQGCEKLLEVLPEQQILKKYSDIHTILN